MDTQDDILVVAPNERLFIVRLPDRHNYHEVPHREVLIEHLMAGTAIQLVSGTFAGASTDGQRLTNERRFLVAQSQALRPVQYRTLPTEGWQHERDHDRHLNRHLRIVNRDGEEEWHHCPNMWRLADLMSKAAALPLEEGVAYVLRHLDEAAEEYDNSVLRAMARTMAA